MRLARSCQCLQGRCTAQRLRSVDKTLIGSSSGLSNSSSTSQEIFESEFGVRQNPSLNVSHRKLLPNDLFGCDHNKKLVIRNLVGDIPKRVSESIVLRRLMRGLKLRELRSFYFGENAESQLYDRRTWNMMAKVLCERLIIFVTRHILIPMLRCLLSLMRLPISILRTFLFVSVSGLDTRQMTFFRRLQWVRFNLSRQNVPPGLSYRPKSKSFRAIVNFRRV